MFVKICRSVLKVVLVDVNPQVVRAWQGAFADTPEAEIVHGSILNQTVDAWVTPTNARGRMDGGVDAVIKHHLGPQIEKRVREEIGRRHQGTMPVGYATCVPTGVSAPRFLISTPTMVSSSEDVSDTVNVALASAAAFQAIHLQNALEPDSITSAALPGLGAATGRVPPGVCANLMWTGYSLFNDGDFQDFESMRAALRERLGEVGPPRESARVRQVAGAARQLLRPTFLVPG
jgi:O-acetyl-ADP-ribose deacetylase (regulator of RNase III)